MTLKLTASSVTTSAFTEDQFGVNILSTRDELGEDGTYDDAVEELGSSLIRYPGGSLTENYFDLTDPDATEAVNVDTGEAVDLLPYSEFMTYAAENDISVTVVLPTRNNLSEETDDNGDRYAEIDEGALRQFVEDTLNGVYGDAEIQAFEIGNEYWGSGEMSSVEYGRVASEMAAIIDDEVNSYLEENPEAEDVDIVVQMGQNYGDAKLSTEYEGLSNEEQVAAVEADYGIDIDGNSVDWSTVADQLILNEFDTEAEIEAVDGVVAHVYSKAPYKDFSRTWDLEEVDAADWDETFGDDLTRYVTEWNQSASSGVYDKATDYGLKNAKEILEIAETFPDHNVEAANIWAVQQNTATDLAHDEGQDGLTVNGEMFKMMASSLPGKYEIDLSPDDEDDREATDEETGDEVHAFANEDSLSVFAFAGQDTTGEMSIDLNELIESYGSVSITKLGVEEGQDPGSANADAVVETLDPEEVLTDGILTVGVSAFEVLQIDFGEAALTDELAAMIPEEDQVEEEDGLGDVDVEEPDMPEEDSTEEGAGSEDDPDAEDDSEAGDEDSAEDDMGDVNTDEPDMPEDDGAAEEEEHEESDGTASEDEEDLGDTDADTPDMPEAEDEGAQDPQDQDEDEQLPEEIDDEQSSGGGGGADGTCFVATAAYDDPLHPDVCDMRRVRDEHLVHYAAGRAFIAFYWKVGPPMARYVRRHPALARISRAMISRLIANLRKTVLDTPGR